MARGRECPSHARVVNALMQGDSLAIRGCLIAPTTSCPPLLSSFFQPFVTLRFPVRFNGALDGATPTEACRGRNAGAHNGCGLVPDMLLCATMQPTANACSGWWATARTCALPDGSSRCACEPVPSLLCTAAHLSVSHGFSSHSSTIRFAKSEACLEPLRTHSNSAWPSLLVNRRRVLGASSWGEKYVLSALSDVAEPGLGVPSRFQDFGRPPVFGRALPCA